MTVAVPSLHRPAAVVHQPNHQLDATILASVIVVNYNSQAHLENCLPALLDTIDDETEVIVVDNGSVDGSLDRIAGLFPKIRLVCSRNNLGYGGGNNLGAQQAHGRYLVFLNPDTVPMAGWLAALTTALEDDPQAGLATSKIVFLHQPDRLNTAGNDLHLTGLTLCRGLGRPVSALDQPAAVGAASGAAFAIRRELFELLGGFDERFFMYMEDTDLSLRAQLAGYHCLYVPQSVIQHDYSLRFGPQKSYYQERNRYLMLLKVFRWPTLFILIPVLALAEVITWGYVLLHDRQNWANKLRAYGYVLHHWRQILADRDETQMLRQVPDRELLHRSVYRLDYAQASAGKVSCLAHLCFDPFFKFWHRLMLVIARW
jgi:GT2 family glycosyltransferase